MRHLHPTRWFRGLRPWKVRDTTYVAVCCSPSDGLTAVVCRTGTERPQVLASHHLPGALASAPNVLALAQALSAGGLPWVWVLGREDYLLLVMDKPPLPAAEMSAGIAWALEPRIDFPTEQASVAWMAIPQPDTASDTPQIYAVASRRDLMNRTRSLFDQAKIALEVVDVPETAQRNIAALLERDDECLAMLSFEADGALLTFTWRGELYLNRFIVQPLQDIDRADAPGRARILERLVSHYLQSLEFLTRQYSFLPVSRLMVAPAAFEWDIVPALAKAVPHAVESIDLSHWVDFDPQKVAPSPTAQARLWRALGATLRQEAVRA